MGRAVLDLIEIDGLAHGYAGRTVLTIAGWRLAPDGRALVTGPSGSGKSTLLSILSGLLIPEQGTVRAAGHDWRAMSSTARDRARGRDIGIVFQSFHLIGAISIADNLRLAQRLSGAPRDDQRIGALLRDLGLGAFGDARPSSLSQGERQRAAIARAVVNRPKLILADEPTSALDDANAEAVVDLLFRQAEASGAGLVVATHDRRIVSGFETHLTLETGA